MMGTWTQVGNVKGPAGDDGKSAYDLWLEAGNSGTIQDFLASLIGAAGADGGDDGPHLPTHRIQQVTMFNMAGGTFTLSFEGQTTEPLTRGDDSSMPGTVVGPLQSLSSMSDYNFFVTQQYAGTIFTFTGWPEGTTQIPDITIDATGLISNGQPVDVSWTRSDPPDPIPATQDDLASLNQQVAISLSQLAQLIPTPKDTGWRAFGVAGDDGTGGDPILAEGLIGGLLSEDFGSRSCLAIRRRDNLMEVMVDISVPPNFSPSAPGEPGPATPYEVFELLTIPNGSGFDLSTTNGIVPVKAIPLTLPVTGLTLQLQFYGSLGVKLVAFKANGTSWSDVARLDGGCSFLATLPFPSEVKGRRLYDPELPSYEGFPDAPPPSSRRVFSRANLSAVNDQPTVAGKFMRISAATYNKIHIGYGDYNDDTGPIDVLQYDFPHDALLTPLTSVPTEQIQAYRILDDGWVWASSIDPRGGDPAFLITNKPAPGDPGPQLETWRIVTINAPAGLPELTHAYDVTQVNGALFVIGGRDMLPAEKTASGFDVNADGGVGIVWRSDDDGTTWTEVVADWSMAGPNGYTRIYAIGRCGDRLFTKAFGPIDSDGNPDENSAYEGYWQMDPDGTWSRRGPVDPTDVRVNLDTLEQYVPSADHAEFGLNEYHDTGALAFYYDEVDGRLKAHRFSDAAMIVGRIEHIDGSGEWILRAYYDGGPFNPFRYQDGTVLPVDRLAPTNLAMGEPWTFASVPGGQLFVCNGAQVNVYQPRGA